MDKVIHLLEEGTVSFPRLLLLHYGDYGLSEREVLVLVYLLNEQDTSFNPKNIADALKISLPEALEIIDHLSTKGLLTISLKKVNGLREEHILFDGLYEKLAYSVVNEELEENHLSKTIYDLFEQEFGRTLSPMEYEIIGGWKDAGYEEELMIMALKEATYNGVSNLRYIDKILYEWKKKGFTKKEDVERDRNAYQARKVEKKELFDYDWLNDQDE